MEPPPIGLSCPPTFPRRRCKPASGKAVTPPVRRCGTPRWVWRTPIHESIRSPRPKRSPLFNPATKNLGDLYRAIDWTKADEGSLEAQGDEEISLDPDFKRKFRLSLLQVGLELNEEIVDEETRLARRDTARTMLHGVGVWQQVVKLMT